MLNGTGLGWGCLISNPPVPIPNATCPKIYYLSMIMKAAELWEQTSVKLKASEQDTGPSDNKSIRCVIANHQSSFMECRVLYHAQLIDHFLGNVVILEDQVEVFTNLGGVIKPTEAVSMFFTLALQNGVVLTDNIEVTNFMKDGR